MVGVKIDDGIQYLVEFTDNPRIESIPSSKMKLAWPIETIEFLQQKLEWDISGNLNVNIPLVQEAGRVFRKGKRISCEFFEIIHSNFSSCFAVFLNYSFLIINLF